MHDVTWRTGLTFGILVLLVLLGSGRIVEYPGPAPTPRPTAEGTRSASPGAGPSTPVAGAALQAVDGETLFPGSVADRGREVPDVRRVPRQHRGQAEMWR